MSHLNRIYFLPTCEHTWSTIYLYGWRPNRSCRWMLWHIHALMIVVKSKGNWMVRYVCTLRFKCSCACMFTCFVDLMLTCILALTIIYSHVNWLIWTHAFMFTSYEIHIHTCKHTWSIIYVYAWRSKRLSSWMWAHTCFDEIG